MSTKATELRKGMVIEKDGDLLLITDYSHATPGNWRAIIQIKTRSLRSGQAGQFRPAAGDPFEVAFLDKRRSEYLYRESNGDFMFMDSESYEQFPLSEELVGEAMNFVRENATVEVTFHDTSPIGIELPSTVVLKVADAEMAVKGNTASNAKKDAVLETGFKIRVPLHIVAGEEVKVKTETGEFQGRANS